MTTITSRNRSEVEADIRDTFGIVPSFFDSVPDEVLGKEWDVMKHCELGETSIPNKYKELLMLAVQAERGCQYCTLYHTEVAKMFGATDEEIEEAVFLAKLSTGWSVFLNGIREDYDRFASELEEIGEYMMEPA